METTEDSKECVREQTELPFILNFLEYREGAVSATTCGTFADIDCSDWA